MFDKYGEFDSAEDMNREAARLLEKGEDRRLMELARENGLDEEDAQDYIDGAVEELATPLMAADGKLMVEAEGLGIREGVLALWLGQIRQMCAEDLELCLAVRRKGKRLEECLAVMVKYSFEHKVRVSDRVVDLVRVEESGKTVPMKKPLYLGFPDNVQARRLARGYYMGGGAG